MIEKETDDHLVNDPAMWRLTEDDMPLCARLLRATGFDFDAPSIDIAIRDLRPATLGAGALALLNESELEDYYHHQRVLQQDGCPQLPAPVPPS